MVPLNDWHRLAAHRSSLPRRFTSLVSTMSDPEGIWCNDSYTPTPDQYFAALGSFGSSVVIIGGLITLGLFILFFEQVVYTNQTAHRGFRRHIYWIASVFPIMTLMSLMALLIPRAHNVCTSVKMVYMSIGISHFTDLTMVMFGGEELLLQRAREDTFNLRLSPVCCCCKCLPRPPVTKYSLRLVVLLTDQLPFVQAFYYVMVLILLAADNITLGDVNPANAFLWLNIMQFASVLLGVYGFMILSSFSHGYLDDFKYRKKSRSIRLLTFVTNLQSLVFNIMANYDAFPCLPPYVPPTVYKQTVDNTLFLLELMILGPYTYWQYHDLQFESPISVLPLYDSSSISHRTASTTCSICTEDSDSTSNSSTNKAGEARHQENDDDNNSVNSMKENGVVVSGNCDRGNSVITTQVTSMDDGALASDSGLRGSRATHKKDSSKGDNGLASKPNSSASSARASNCNIQQSSSSSRSIVEGAATSSSRKGNCVGMNTSRESSATTSERKTENRSKMIVSLNNSGKLDGTTASNNKKNNDKSATTVPSDNSSDNSASNSGNSKTVDSSSRRLGFLGKALNLAPRAATGSPEYVRFKD